MKKFEKPEMQILDVFEDIIVTSNLTDPGNENPESPIINF